MLIFEWPKASLEIREETYTCPTGALGGRDCRRRDVIYTLTNLPRNASIVVESS